MNSLRFILSNWFPPCLHTSITTFDDRWPRWTRLYNENILHIECLPGERFDLLPYLAYSPFALSAFQSLLQTLWLPLSLPSVFTTMDLNYGIRKNGASIQLRFTLQQVGSGSFWYPDIFTTRNRDISYEVPTSRKSHTLPYPFYRWMTCYVETYGGDTLLQINVHSDLHQAWKLSHVN